MTGAALRVPRPTRYIESIRNGIGYRRLPYIVILERFGGKLDSSVRAERQAYFVTIH